MTRKRPARTISTECQWCGTTFMACNRNNRTCSAEECQARRIRHKADAGRARRALARRIAQQRHCGYCDKPLSLDLSGKRKYCSDKCRLARNSKHMSMYNRKKLYGITQDDVDRMLVAQGGACAICRRNDWPRLSGKDGPHVDHDHATGRVRGVLCQSCNHGLGKFKDDPLRLRAAAEYLELAS